ncbi:unnamed protein product [Urochloa decumbens]|uniref:Uncharacterized protein n=1 Tax=Urochloa decumbens TaxID=240449 RepID=A0ABC9D802_9POAL
MTKAQAILIALSIVVLFSFNSVDGGAYMSHAALSRKGLKEEPKLATSGLSPSASLSGLESSKTNGVNSNPESTNTDMSGAGPAYTPTTTITADSHHDLSVDQYRRIIHNNQIKP